MPVGLSEPDEDPVSVQEMVVLIPSLVLEQPLKLVPLPLVLMVDVIWAFNSLYFLIKASPSLNYLPLKSEALKL